MQTIILSFLTRKTMRIRQFVLALVTAGVIIGAYSSEGGLSVIAGSTGQSTAPSQAKLTQVSAARIGLHIEFLASDKLQGRRAGTVGADLAAKYIASQFQDYGLEKLDKLDQLNRAQNKDYLQPFTFVSGVSLGAKNE